jgi:NDP-sugar pyrophosphorylase family protein
MLDVYGWPILAYNIQLLAGAGFDRIVLNLHYLPEAVRSFVGDGACWGLSVRYSEEPVLLGTAGALVPVSDEFREGPFAIVFGDNIAEIDLLAMCDVHARSGADATIALWRREDVTQSGVAELDAGGRIVRFIEKPSASETTSHWVNAGIIIAEPALLDVISHDGPSDFGRDVFPAAIARGMHLQGYQMTGRLWWFDRVQDYLTALADPHLSAFASRVQRLSLTKRET